MYDDRSLTLTLLIAFRYPAEFALLIDYKYRGGQPFNLLAVNNFQSVFLFHDEWRLTN